MTRFLMTLIFLVSIFLTSTSLTQAAPPTGSLDLANGTRIAGWASDPDYSGPIMVHLYIDGQIFEDVAAKINRADVGAHAFDYLHSPLGAGDHLIMAYAIGVNSQGIPDGENVGLGGAPKTINTGCNGLTSSDFVWCRDNPNYWVNRQANVKRLWNRYIRIATNTSYGGLITELYPENRSFNYLEEHGGSASQISLYGYDLSQGNSGAYFVSDGSICTKYSDQNSCQSQNLGKTCVARGAANGSHVANCTTMKTCNGVDAGWPYNPIQAQGINCSWEDNSNNVSSSSDCSSQGSPCFQLTTDHFYQFSKTTLFPELALNQKITLGDIYAQIDYQLTYNGQSLNTHPQEIPAFFSNTGISHHVYYYAGANPYTNDQSNIKSLNLSTTAFNLGLPHYNVSQSVTDRATEAWWTVCNSDDTHCVTLASFSPDYQYVNLSIQGSSTGYLTPMGEFPLTPGLNKSIRLYVSPYRYDTSINNQTIRDRITALAISAGEVNPTPAPSLDYRDYLQSTSSFTNIFTFSEVISSLWQ